MHVDAAAAGASLPVVNPMDRVAVCGSCTLQGCRDAAAMESSLEISPAVITFAACRRTCEDHSTVALVGVLVLVVCVTKQYMCGKAVQV